ncbi:hypothetical protein V8F33_007651 [Rhypophila sp. PSN 637]
MRKVMDRDGVQRAAFPLAANILGRFVYSQSDCLCRCTVVPSNREKTANGHLAYAKPMVPSLMQKSSPNLERPAICKLEDSSRNLLIPEAPCEFTRIHVSKPYQALLSTKLKLNHHVASALNPHNNVVGATKYITGHRYSFTMRLWLFVQPIYRHISLRCAAVVPPRAKVRNCSFGARTWTRLAKNHCELLPFIFPLPSS